MKKIFTFFVATFLTVALFAADRRPIVTLKASRNYEIVIDGRSYFSSSGVMNISDIGRGQHSIKVFEANRYFMYRRGKRLVDASFFQLRNNDIDIKIDFRGQINITEDRFGHDKWNDQRDNGYDHDQRDNGRDDNYGRDQKDRHDQDSRDKDHGNNKNDRDKRF